MYAVVIASIRLVAAARNTNSHTEAIAIATRSITAALAECGDNHNTVIALFWLCEKDEHGRAAIESMGGPASMGVLGAMCWDDILEPFANPILQAHI